MLAYQFITTTKKLQIVKFIYYNNTQITDKMTAKIKVKPKKEELELIRSRSWPVFFGDPNELVEVGDLNIFRYAYRADIDDRDYEEYDRLWDKNGTTPSYNEWARVSPRITAPNLRVVRSGIEIRASPDYAEKNYYRIMEEYGLERRTRFSSDKELSIRASRFLEIERWLGQNLWQHKRKGISEYGKHLIDKIYEVMRNPNSLLVADVLTKGRTELRDLSSIDFDAAYGQGVHVDIEITPAATHILGVLATIDSRYVFGLDTDTETRFYPV